ncbi:hypothetical protein M406DRAFT_347157 [Cryphonectria parasitica EP155]|uniref:Amino acid transporter transmembrane domain-containing protein n=1 Tax=Cryphonectria parasitica (strain ATCC 38755 / EP155) TaxID=660469 RepID=A0A9P5CN22_CRYP1|nr:uncharacterized protein M406DRAFT_347157 [Cryphonectria parasitica EP155]KAF3763460.1 hypothetical protein M406DRAFT_347157 [Cryphonectria parasitica EP155]
MDAVWSIDTGYIRPQARKLHDPDVTFEEYHYYALQTRELERNEPRPKTNWREIILRAKPKTEGQEAETGDITSSNLNFANRANRLEITDEEWSNASRAFRTASAGACFYLITTDILGPYGVGFAMGALGWMPGIILYSVFGFMAGYGGYLLWHIFLGLDSYQFPLRNFGDLGFRLYGGWARHILNVLQALALLLILGQVTIQNGQALSQVSKFRICYAVCPIIFVAAGFALGQVRTLRRFGLIANLAIWLNLLVIFITMGIMAHSPPNFAISVLGSAGALVDPDSITPDANGIYPPVKHYNYLPDPSSLTGSLNGLMSGVLAYGGAQLFIEFMAEMRRPYDFLKAMWGAQFFIYSVYMIYGCYVYYFQGQYAYQISYQGVSAYGFQTAGNMLAFISGLIAAALYGNIGIKVFYNNVLMDLFSAPPLTTKSGKILWAIIVPIWWSIAYIIAAAIPDYFGFVSVISSATLLEFTYCFPPMLALAYDIQLNAIVEGEGFDPVTGAVIRKDKGLKRWVRGFFRGRWWLNILHLLYACGAWATAGLGLYAAIEGMIEAFENPQLNSFTCTSPLNLNA